MGEDGKTNPLLTETSTSWLCCAFPTVIANSTSANIKLDRFMIVVPNNMNVPLVTDAPCII
jgi:hypothetical protein